MIDHCVIVGGGHGGAQLCASLRQNGYSGEITMVSKDDCLPYHRPPLSKAFLKDTTTENQIIKPQAFYDDNDIELLLDTELISIDRSLRVIKLNNGRELSYSKLILATGAKARLLDIPGASAAGVHYLKFVEDAVRLRGELSDAKNVCVIGGGFIGLEAAATFASLGKEVTVFEAGPRLLGRAVSPEVSAFFLDKHRASGMKIHLNASVEAIISDNDKAMGVKSDTGLTNADIILIGVGVVSNSDVAETAGLKCANGIEVDSHMQTSDPDILAIGDCVAFEHWQTNSRVRLESVQNANDQARNATLTIIGKPQTFKEVPWFWSDQGDDKLQIVGLSNEADQKIVRDQPALNKITVYHFNGPQLIAIDTVNNQAVHMIGRRILSGPVSPKYSEVAAPEFDFRAYFKSTQ